AGVGANECGSMVRDAGDRPCPIPERDRFANHWGTADAGAGSAAASGATVATGAQAALPVGRRGGYPAQRGGGSDAAAVARGFRAQPTSGSAGQRLWSAPAG